MQDTSTRKPLLKSFAAAFAVLAIVGTVFAGGRNFSHAQRAKLYALAFGSSSQPSPTDMFRLGENEQFGVPSGQVLSVNGIITTENWTDESTVVIRFDGETVFKRKMLAGDVLTMPPGLAATPGTVVEIDRLSAATDSRVMLLCYLSQTL